MFENIIKIFKNIGKKEEKKQTQESSKDAAKERLHLVLMQDRANVSADFLELMKQEIIDVIKKYIEIDEKEIDVRLTNQENEDGTNGAPALYANIPILNIKNDARKIGKKDLKETQEQPKNEEIKKTTKQQGKNSIEKEEKDEDKVQEVKKDNEAQEEVKEIKEEVGNKDKSNEKSNLQDEKATKQKIKIEKE